MLIQHIKAATMVVRTIREDWDQRSVYAQIEQLAGGEFTHADVVWACITVAENFNFRAPSMLSAKGPDLIARLHEKTSTNRTRTVSPGRTKNQYACDTCGLTQDLCEQQAGNLDGSDHTFKTITQAEREREQERYARSPERAEAKAEVAKHWRPPVPGAPTGWSNVGKLPSDVEAQHPEPQQEEAAS